MAVHQSRVLKDSLYTFVAWFLNGFASLLPRKSSMLIGIVIGELVAILSKRDRERAINNIQYSLHVGRGEAKKIAKLCYRNVGKNLVEFLQFSGRLKKWIHHDIAIEGKVYIDRALDEGKGAIGVSGHLGNWELLPVGLASHGYKGRAITRELRSKWLNKFVHQHREKAGYIALNRDRSVREALNCLDRNELLGILADIDTKTKGVFVQFFNRSAYTPYGPIAIALKTGTPILPMFIIRQADNKHRLVVEPPMILHETGDYQLDLVTNTQYFTEIIESYIRRYPEQWIWMHDRWKTQPKTR